MFLLFSVKLGEENIESLIKKFSDLISQSGVIEKVDNWGKRRLAYLVNKEPEGIYVSIGFKAESGVPCELGRVANITEGVLRCLVIKKEE
jgi:small subunit ribosomal protein S6